MLKLGFVSAILEDLDLEGVLETAQKNKYECVEVMCWPKQNGDHRRYAGCSHIDVESLDVAHIYKLCKNNGVTISGLGYYPNPLDADSQKSEFYIEHIKKVIRACNALDVPVMNTFIGRNQWLPMSENIEIFKKLWKPIIETAKKEGIKIGIENCPMSFTNDEWPGGKNLAISPAIWDIMFETFPAPLFGLNYDPSHMIFQMMDEIKPIYQYKDRLHHVHLKDVTVPKDMLDRVGVFANPSEFHIPKLPGRGDVRGPLFFEALKDINYSGPVVLEMEDRDYEGSLEAVNKGMFVARDYLRQFL
jgi:sugar phosphate isomerase/epimerase